MTDEQKANLSQELIAKAMQCETAEQLVELAKQQLKAVAGGYLCGEDGCNCRYDI